MRIFNTEVKITYHPYFGEMYHCYKYDGEYLGNVAYCDNLWEVVKFVFM